MRTSKLVLAVACVLGGAAAAQAEYHEFGTPDAAQGIVKQVRVYEDYAPPELEVRVIRLSGRTGTLFCTQPRGDQPLPDGAIWGADLQPVAAAYNASTARVALHRFVVANTNDRIRFRAAIAAAKPIFFGLYGPSNGDIGLDVHELRGRRDKKLPRVAVAPGATTVVHRLIGEDECLVVGLARFTPEKGVQRRREAMKQLAPWSNEKGISAPVLVKEGEWGRYKIFPGRLDMTVAPVVGPDGRAEAVLVVDTPSWTPRDAGETVLNFMLGSTYEPPVKGGQAVTALGATIVGVYWDMARLSENRMPGMGGQMASGRGEMGRAGMVGGDKVDSRAGDSSDDTDF